jgi:hypothetical protein
VRAGTRCGGTAVQAPGVEGCRPGPLDPASGCGIRSDHHNHHDARRHHCDSGQVRNTRQTLISPRHGCRAEVRRHPTGARSDVSRRQPDAVARAPSLRYENQRRTSRRACRAGCRSRDTWPRTWRPRRAALCAAAAPIDLALTATAPAESPHPPSPLRGYGEAGPRTSAPLSSLSENQVRVAELVP